MTLVEKIIVNGDNMSGREKVVNCINKSFKQIVSFKKTYLMLSLGIKILQGVIPAVNVVLLQKIINIIQKQNRDIYTLVFYILIYVSIYEFLELISLVYMKYSNDFGLEFSMYINTKMIDKALELSLYDFENSETYNIINRAQSQSGNDIINYVESVFNTIQQIIAVISMGYILLKFRWQIVAVIVMIPIIKSVLIYRLDKQAYQIRVRRTTTERKKWYLNFLVMTGNAFKEIKIFGLKQFILHTYSDLQRQIVKEEKQIFFKQTLTNIGLELLEGILSGGILFYILRFAYLKVILIGDATAYIDSVDSIKGYVNGIFNAINNIIEQSMYICFLYEYLELSVKNDNNKIKIERIDSIKFENVSFRYNSGSYGVRNLNFEITSNQTIAIIGENGSGKTTLMKLLLGLYTNYEGRILINGMTLDAINRDLYYKKISAVFQDFIKYETSLRENIAYGDIEKINEERGVSKLIEKIGLKEKTNNSRGIDVILGKWFGENQCSGGEWQRIAIARALFNENAEMYFFDEPDAALDIIKQKEIYKLIREKTKNKICVYVTHKISNICKDADTIIILKNGKIEDIGRHDELINKINYYYQLYLKYTSEKEKK